MTADSEPWPEELAEGIITITDDGGQNRLNVLRSLLIIEPINDFPVDIVGVFSRFNLSGEGDFRLILTDEYPIRRTGGFTAWQERSFNRGEGGFPESAELEADSDGDGVINLLEYAFGGDPHRVDRMVLPTVSVNGNQMEILFRRSKVADDLVYEVESSEDLVLWESIWGSVDFPYDSIYEKIEERVVWEGESKNGQRRFSRVRISGNFSKTDRE